MITETELAGALLVVDIPRTLILIFLTWFLWRDFLKERAGARESLLLLSVVGMVVTIFSIAAHEVAHGVADVAMGLDIKRIGIGVDFNIVVNTMPSVMTLGPRAELAVWAAGPLANLILGLLLIILTSHPKRLSYALVLRYAGILNLFSVAVNMVPATFSDGGHVIYAIVWSISGNQDFAVAMVQIMWEITISVMVATALYLCWRLWRKRRKAGAAR
jgi:Zn-dependent protease